MNTLSTERNLVCGIILAAGRGRRFGGDKLLAALDDESTVIGQVIQRMSSVVSQCICVVRADDLRLQCYLDSIKALWISIDSADEGMSQSLIAGINHFSEASAWLIGLGDMPYVKVTTYEQICQAYCQEQSVSSTSCIVVPAISDEEAKGGLRRGNPVLFSHDFLLSLNRIAGDVGGKAVIAENPESVRLLTINDTGILLDVDVPEDIRSGS